MSLGLFLRFLQALVEKEKVSFHALDPPSLSAVFFPPAMASGGHAAATDEPDKATLRLQREFQERVDINCGE